MARPADGRRRRRGNTPASAETVVAHPPDKLFPPQRAFDFAQVGGEFVETLGEGLRRVRVFQAAAGEDADGGLSGEVDAVTRELQHAGNRRRRCRFDEDPLLTREEGIGIQDLLVGDGVDAAAGLVAGGDREVP